jgi:CheY-like chemotaxis protein
MRILLIHWKQTEAEDRAAPPRNIGHTVTVHWDSEDGAGLRRYRETSPDAIVISLDRLPSQGVGVATWFRQQARTRQIPLVFAGGKVEKVQAARRQLPDAIYTDWDSLAKALKQAVGTPVNAPVVPGTMQSYAGVPLSKKLGLKANCRVALLGAPERFEEKLSPMPAGVTVRKQARGEFAVVLQFVRSMAELEQRFSVATKVVADGGRIWFVWPKKTSGMMIDVTQATVRRFGLERNWVDFKIAAIDEIWSGLAFARRKRTGRAE